MRLRISRSALALVAGALALLAASVAAAEDARLEDPDAEARAVAIGRQLRCVVCQNQSIEESRAPLAEDLRRLVREHVAAGETDEEIIDHVVARYGHFVLLKPPMTPATLALWFGPAILAAAALAAVILRARGARGEARAAPPLSEDEARRLAALMKGDDT